MDLNLRRVHIPVHILRLFDRSGSENIRLPVPLRGRVFDPCPSTLQQLIVQGRAQNFSLGPRPKSRKSRPNTKLVGAVVGEGAASPLPTPTRGLGERCELPKRGSGRSPDRPKVFHYFQHSGWPLLTLQYC